MSLFLFSGVESLVRRHFDGMYGQEEIIKEVIDLIEDFWYESKRSQVLGIQTSMEEHRKTFLSNNHISLCGNPGVGKTEVARIISRK